MKPISISPLEHRLARHGPRACRRRRVSPATDCFFRPEAEVAGSRARCLPGHRARRAFRQMTAEMLIQHERDEPLEVFLFAFVAAIAAWPLVDLLIVLAQIAHG